MYIDNHPLKYVPEAKKVFRCVLCLVLYHLRYLIEEYEYSPYEYNPKRMNMLGFEPA